MIKSQNITRSATCKNCGLNIKRKEFGAGRHGEWLHGTGERRCIPGYAAPKEPW